MTREELIEILKTGLDEDELKREEIGKIIIGPDIHGCFQIKNMWFYYDGQDERGNIDFIGPFNDKAIIYAIAVKLYKTSLFSDYKFSEAEMDIFCDNHFSSIEEIKEKYPELN